MKKALLVLVIMLALVLSACTDDGDGDDVRKTTGSKSPIVLDI